MIEFHNVSHRFGARTVLRDINLSIAERRVAVVGGNGSGKSTLARLFNALLVPTAGRVLIDGLDTRSEARAIRRKVGFVFQNPDAQIVMPLVEEDIAFGLKNLRLPKAEIGRKTDEILARYGLVHLRHQHTHTQRRGKAAAGALLRPGDGA
jgi:biotin transport system ATP-binding protein